MRDDIVKYLGTVLNSTAKTIADRIGVDRLEVSKELNHMHSEAIVEREKRAGGGNEYVYWLSRNDSGVGMHPETLPTAQYNPPATPSVVPEKTDIDVEEALRNEVGELMGAASQLSAKLSAAEEERDRLQAEVLDLKISGSNRQDKIRVLEARCANLEATIKDNASSLAERYNALCTERDQIAVELRGVQAANAKLVEEIETLREQIRGSHRPIGSAVAEALKPFLIPGQKVIWREPFRWHDEEGFMPNHYEGMSIEAIAESFGYDIVVNCELAAIIEPQGKKNDAINDVADLEKA